MKGRVSRVDIVCSPTTPPSAARTNLGYRNSSCSTQMFDIADTTNHSLYYTTGTICQLAVVSNSCHLELSKNSSATMFEYVLLLIQAFIDTPMIQNSRLL